MAKRFVMLMMLLAVEVGCPHAWSRGGTIDQAMERDMIEYYALRDCALDEEDWAKFCRNFNRHKNDPEAQQRCPQECRPRDDEP